MTKATLTERGSDMSRAKLVSDELRLMAEFQQVEIGFQIEQFSDFLSDRQSFQKGKQRDQRKHSTPKALRELLKVLMRFFEVDAMGMCRKDPKRFIDSNWREVSYAELRKASRKSDALTRNTIKRWLKKLEAKGIIERTREFCAKASTTKLWIKFCAGTLLDIFRTKLPGMLKRKATAKLKIQSTGEGAVPQPEIAAENTSNSRSEYLSDPEENEPAPRVIDAPTYCTSITPLVDSTLSVIDSDGLQVQKEEINPSSASPSREDSSILKEDEIEVSVATVENWEVLSEFFPTVSLLTRKQAKFLNKLTNHPVAKYAMTLTDVKLYAEYQHADPSDVPGWNYTFCLDIFLANWSKVKAQLYARKNEVHAVMAENFLRQLEEVKDDYTRAHAWATRRLDVQDDIDRGNILDSFVTAFHAKLDLTPLIVSCRSHLRAWAEKCPSMFIKICEFLPAQEWAGFNSEDWNRIVGKAFLEHVRAYTYIGNYEKYA